MYHHPQVQIVAQRPAFSARRPGSNTGHADGSSTKASKKTGVKIPKPTADCHGAEHRAKYQHLFDLRKASKAAAKAERHARDRALDREYNQAMAYIREYEWQDKLALFLERRKAQTPATNHGSALDGDKSIELGLAGLQLQNLFGLATKSPWRNMLGAVLVTAIALSLVALLVWWIF